MRIYQGNGLGDFYYKLIRDITKDGREIVIRGRRCMELPEPVTLIYNKPGYCWMDIPSRKFNPFFALAEVVWILTGKGSVKWISYFNSRMATFADGDAPELHGAYGVRLRRVSHNTGGHWQEPIDQIAEVRRKLLADPTTRQAVMSLWDPVRDNVDVSKDYPCNNVVYYSLRDGVLNQTVVIRSNDLVWGTPYNAIQFSHLQALVAGEVGAEIGTLTYVVQNLHYYFDEYKMTLANLLEQAHDDSEIKALSVPGFCPTTDAELRNLDGCLDQIALNYRGPDVYNVEPNFRFGDWQGSGYWGWIIPQMVWIFTAIKEQSVPAPRILERISMLGQPLTNLILDFYRGSENTTAQELWAQSRVV